MYSDMSTWIIASSSPNRNSASVRASSVLPTPEGPRKMKLPVGRFGSLIPARARRIDFATATIASSWPTTRLWSSSSILTRRADSASVSLKTGIPVHIETMSAISSSPTCGCSSPDSEVRHCSSSSRFFCVSLRSLSRSEAAFSNSWFSIEASFSLRTRSISSSSSRYRELEDEIERVRKEKEASIENQEFEKAASLRDKERKLTQKKRELEEQWRTSESGEEQPQVGEEEIADIVSMWTGIPVFKLTEAESARLVKMEEELHKRVVGQDEAIVAVAKSIRRARAGIKDPKRPTGSFIFLGPSGVGKTELARTLAEFLFGDEDAMIQVDMSEYMEKHSVSRLVGSPPGYIGYDEGGQLTEAVRRKPYSVLLLDEIEKAHPDVFNILLQILEEGKLTDAQGRRVDFRNAIVIMTSNLGAAQISKNTGFGFTVGDESGLSYDEMKGRVMGELKKVFRPELLNRIDEIIVFHKLSKDEIMSIVDLLLRRLREQMATHEVSIELTDEAKELLVDKGYAARSSAISRIRSRTSCSGASSSRARRSSSRARAPTTASRATTWTSPSSR